MYIYIRKEEDKSNYFMQKKIKIYKKTVGNKMKGKKLQHKVLKIIQS